MKYISTLIILSVLLLSSCGIQVQKRLYRDGFYVSTSKKSAAASHDEDNSAAIKSTAQAKPVDVITGTVSSSTAHAEPPVDSVTTPAPASSEAHEVKTATTDSSNVSKTADATQSSPPGDAAEAEIASLRDLNTVSLLMLIGWFLLPGLAFIASIVLASIILSRIGDLKRNYTLAESQSAEVNRMRKLQLGILIAAAAILILTVLLVVSLFVFAAGF